MLSERHEQGLQLIYRIAGNLDLSHEDAGTMLGVTGADVAAWENGSQAIPDAVFSMLHNAGNALSRMLTLFLPDKLPQVIRRRADAFGGERALDWILDGRISDVADIYDGGLSYLKKTA